MQYFLYLLAVIGIFGILAISLELVAGQIGLISVAHAAFYGIGAYASALLTVRLGAPFLVGLAAGAIIAGIASLAVSIPSLRLHGDYFVIATFAFQMIVFSLLNNWLEVTRGPLGISGIPRPRILGWTVESMSELAVLTWLVALVSVGVVARIARSPFGRVLRAIREDEVYTQCLGKDTLTYKVVSFAVSSALAAIAGSLYAHLITFIDPTSFTVIESVLVISMVIIGGAGSLWGPLVGAVVLVGLPEILRAAGLPTAESAALRQILYGFLLVAMLVVRPKGLFGNYGFGR